uniref:Uncharacterized protein n=1 Tax=viral metagenome TaxID=1070528 RepID=A0A6M3K383_9ZZZZ
MKNRAQEMRDRVRARAERNRLSGGLDTLSLPEGVELHKPEKGTEEFDIIPYRVTVDNHPEVKKGEVWYERTYFAHRAVGPEEKFIICPRTIGKACPICEEYQRLKKDPDADEDVVKALRAKERELFNVVLKEGKGEVMLLDISVHLFGRKLEEEILEGDEANAAFAELKGGKTLKVRWEKKSMGANKFVEAGRIDFLDRDDIDDEALDLAMDLDKALKILSYEEIEKIFHAGEEEESDKDDTGDDDETEERPKRRIIGGGKKERSDDDSDDKGDDPEENKDPDELPGLGKNAGKKKPDEDEEDDKGDDEDCIACEGTGKTSKNRECPICDGTGKMKSEKKEEPDDDSADDADDDADEAKEKNIKTARKIRR